MYAHLKAAHSTATAIPPETGPGSVTPSRSTVTSVAAINNVRFTSRLLCAKSGHSSTHTAVHHPWPNGPTWADLRWGGSGRKAADRTSAIAGDPSRRNHRPELLSHPGDHDAQARRQLPRM